MDAIGNKILDMEWFAGSQPSNAMMHLRKEVAREKKKRYIFKNTESRRFTRLMRMCADKLGTESALEFFGRLGRDTGPKEFNALIRVCLEKARACGDIDSAVEHIFRAYRLFEMMKDRGFQIDPPVGRQSEAVAVVIGTLGHGMSVEGRLERWVAAWSCGGAVVKYGEGRRLRVARGQGASTVGGSRRWGRSWLLAAADCQCAAPASRERYFDFDC